MKIFFRLLRVDLARGLGSGRFILAAVLTFAAYFFCTFRDMPHFSSLGFLMSYALDESNAYGLVLITATLAYSAAFCADYRSGMLDSFVVRAGPRRYAASKCVAVALSGGLAVALGAALYLSVAGCFSLPVYPSMDDLIMGKYDLYYAFGTTLFGPAPWLYFIGLLYVAFLQGAFWAALGLCASSFLPSPYIACATPFIFDTAYGQLVFFLQLPYQLNWANLSLMSRARFSFGGALQTALVYTVVFAEAILICALIFIRQVKRRVAND